MIDERFMRMALELAAQGAAMGEVPVGCVITDAEGSVIAGAFNSCENDSDATAHAELTAISSACKNIGDWRLTGCTLYVTLEPCPMCAGAIINARIPTVVFGAKDALTGSCGSVLNIFGENYPHKPAIYGGVLAEESAGLLRVFFETLR